VTTRHVSHLLHLWTGGDLDPDRSARVQAHLKLCPTCTAEAEALRGQTAWLREMAEPPFSAADHLAFRAQVMAGVRREAAKPQSHWQVRPALAAAAGILLVLGAGLWLRNPRTTLVPAAQTAPAQARMEPPPPRTDPKPVRPRVTSPPRQRAPAGEPTPVTRMEFQTADPTLRIIWLARTVPSPANQPGPQH
jgi:hypothetical protein